jgi:hypothetical protein
MEDILFDESVDSVEAGSAEVESSSKTPASSHKEAPALAPDTVEEYVPLFGTKQSSTADAPSKCTYQGPAISLQDVITELSPVPKEVIVEGRSSSLVLQDGEANLHAVCNELIEDITEVPRKIGFECHQISSPLEDDGSVSAESVEEKVTNYAVKPFCLTDRASWIRLIQEGNKRKYALREINRNNFRGSGWQDLDISGDYDPNIKSNKVSFSQKIKPRKSMKLEDGDDEPVSKRHQHRALNYEQGRKTGQSMAVKFKFSSENGLVIFRTLAEEYPSPYDSIVGISEKEILDNIRRPFHGGSNGTRTRNQQNLYVESPIYRTLPSLSWGQN